MENNSRNKPQRRRVRKPSPLGTSSQYDLDQELRLAHALEEEVIENFPERGAGDGVGDVSNNFLTGVEQEIGTPQPTPYPLPSPQGRTVLDELLIGDLTKRPCLYEDAEVQEVIKKWLGELGVTTINMLIRTYTAVALMEAIDDMRRAYSSGFRIKSTTGYFRSLLK